jgi:hypothetical protein
MPSAKYVSPSEWRCRCGCGGGDDVVSQRLLDFIDKIRENIGGPITINCIYRCPAHNASLPGAVPNSQHVLGNAADLATPSWLTTNEFRWYCENAEIDGCHIDALGEYSYDPSGDTKGDGFIHIDIRNNGQTTDIAEIITWEDMG